jgi:starch phosphorylase
MVRDYVEQLYDPTAAQTERLTADGAVRAKQLAEWKDRIDHAWDQVEVLSVETDVSVANLGTERVVDAEVSLGSLTADDVAVQLVHGPVGQHDELLAPPTIVTMTPSGEGTGGDLRYRGSFSCEQAGRYGFTVRVAPSHPHLASPVELGRIAWA